MTGLLRSLGLILAGLCLVAACSSSGDSEPDTSGLTSASSDAAEAVGPTSPASTTQTTSATAPTTTAPTTEPPVVQTPGWSTYTIADGLPGDDVVQVDVHFDGTTWALVALGRDDLGKPTNLTLARFGGNEWTQVEPPVPLETAPKLRAGPDGTAWLIGLEAFPVCRNDPTIAGPTGLWYFDGATWATVYRGEQAAGDRLVFDGRVDPAGVFWAIGASDIGFVEGTVDPPSYDGGTYAVSSLLDGEWSDVGPLDHGGVGIDCQQLFMDDSGTVWVDWNDEVVDFAVGVIDRQIHARLDDSEWTEFENPYADLAVGDQEDGLSATVLRTMGPAGTYAYLLVGDVRAYEPDATPPSVGDVVAFGGAIFDDANWGDAFTGELMIGDRHTITPLIDAGFDSVVGDVMATSAFLDDAIYLSGLGGLIRIEPLGDVVALTVADGLASDATHHVTATADGQLWVATDAGVSRYVPESS